MKNLLASLAICLLSSATVLAQETHDPTADMNRFLSKNLKYPIEARANEIEGVVVIQASFDTKGQPTETRVIAGNELLATEVSRTVNDLIDNWNPSYLGDRPKDQAYLMSFRFKIVKDEASTTKIKQMPSKESLEIMQSPEKQLTNRLDANPFDARLYAERAELYTSLSLPVLAEKDLMLAEYFKNKTLTEIVIVGYEVKNKSLSTVD